MYWKKQQEKKRPPAKIYRGLETRGQVHCFEMKMCHANESLTLSYTLRLGIFSQALPTALSNP